jgi:regulator of nucleoside diphosphate kinase
MSATPTITVSSLDMDRIEALIEKMPRLTPEIEKLEQELDRATIVAPAKMPADVVSMNSTVRFSFAGDSKVIQKTLVYPQDAKSEEQISIFAPVGSALLGLAVGQSLEWPLPNGQCSTVEILEVVYQPERAGEFQRYRQCKLKSQKLRLKPNNNWPTNAVLTFWTKRLDYFFITLQIGPFH